MARLPRSEYRRRQSSIRYGLDALTEDEATALRIGNPHGDFYTSMLIEDVSLWVAPVSPRRGGRAKVVLEPSNRNAEQLLTQALARDSEYHRQGLSESVYGFLRSCTQTLIGYSAAPFEIVHLSPPDGEQVVGFELFSIFPPTLRERDGELVQYVPQRLAADGRLPPEIKLDAERLAVFSLPDPVREILSESIYALNAIGRSRSMDLAVQSFEAGSQRLSYDLQSHQYAEHLALAEATKRVGWDARGLFRQRQSEFHVVHRQLTFFRFVAQVRDSILGQLNDVLDKVSQVLAPIGHVRLEGLPTVGDADEAIRHLRAGNRRFKELLDQFMSE